MRRKKVVFGRMYEREDEGRKLPCLQEYDSAMSPMSLAWHGYY